MASAVLAEVLGMHFILGAFIAGLFFSRRAIETRVYNDVRHKMSAITTGLLVTTAMGQSPRVSSSLTMPG